MAATLPADVLAFMERGVSVIVGSRDAQLRPSIMRAVGSRIEQGGREVTVFLSRPQSRQLLQDLAATGRIAVVFSEPSTHRSVQLKASRVEMRAATREDAPELARYLASMENELQQVGYAAGLASALLSHRLEDVVALRFTPEEAYEQTPGPRAGTRIGSAP